MKRLKQNKKRQAIKSRNGHKNPRDPSEREKGKKAKKIGEMGSFAPYRKIYKSAPVLCTAIASQVRISAANFRIICRLVR